MGEIQLYTFVTYDFFIFSNRTLSYGVGYGDFSQWDLEATDVTSPKIGFPSLQFFWI